MNDSNKLIFNPNINTSINNTINKYFDINIQLLLDLFENEYHPIWGFNYEMNSMVKQYYSNVHATIMFLLYLSNLLDRTQLQFMEDALFNLRDNNANSYYKKHKKDKYAWDTIEGPNCFSTALSCYSLLLTGTKRTAEVTKALRWILKNKNVSGIWPIHSKGMQDNIVVTFYIVLLLKKYLALNLNKGFNQSISNNLKNVQVFIEDLFVIRDNNYYVTKYESDDVCLSNTICCLYILKILKSSKFSEYLDGSKSVIENIILDDEDWYISILSNIKENKIKTMYTYNPAYLPILLKLGWNTKDKIIVKMANRAITDIRNILAKNTQGYIWRCSDSLIQTFICAFSIFTIVSWVKAITNSEIAQIRNLSFTEENDKINNSFKECGNSDGNDAIILNGKPDDSGKGWHYYKDKNVRKKFTFVVDEVEELFWVLGNERSFSGRSSLAFNLLCSIVSKPTNKKISLEILYNEVYDEDINDDSKITRVKKLLERYIYTLFNDKKEREKYLVLYNGIKIKSNTKMVIRKK